MQSLPTMPADLAAKIEGSSADTLFRLAAEQMSIYLTILDTAWKDVRPVVEWFIEREQYDEAARWLFCNTPDCIERAMTLMRIKDLKAKQSLT